MSLHLPDILENTRSIYMTKSSLNTLLDFERILDELDIYVFDNWKQGELVEGPKYEKYFVTCTFMWPLKKMPDPRGGERLLDYDCVVKYRKSELEYPVKVKGYDDFVPGTKMPKTAKTPIWLVEITVPKDLMSNIKRGSLELEDETIDSEDVEQSYETGLDDNMYKSGDGEPMDQTGAPEMGQQPNPTAGI